MRGSRAHEPRPACPVDVLVRSAVGVDGAVAQLQPLTVKQELHHVEKVQGEKASVYAREAHRGSKSDTGVRDKVGQVGEAKSGHVKRLSHSAHR